MIDLPPPLPPALERVAAIERIYPDLYAAALARTPTVWDRLRRAARTRWMRTHPCADATLGRRYVLAGGARTKGASWRIVEATWACDQVPHSSRAVLRCVADKEGGRDYPDVWNGFSRGWQGGRFAGSDRVAGHLQDRPDKAGRMVASLRGVTRASLQTFRIITWPTYHARINVQLLHERPSHFSTIGFCS